MTQNSSDLKNYYEVLEVPSAARQEDIYHSYQRAKAAYANDSLALYSLISADECRNILNLVEEAYSILSDPAKRKLYDEARGLNREFNAALYTGTIRDSILEAQATMLAHKPNPDRNHYNQEPAYVTNSDSHHSTNSSSATNVNKLVAQKRFSLDFVANADFDKEIEETQEFEGQFLKKIREYKNIDIDRLSDMTKVSPMNIRAIEDEDYSKLPAAVYVRGFVYQYAKCLKLKPEPVANSYVARMKKVKP